MIDFITDEEVALIEAPDPGFYTRAKQIRQLMVGNPAYTCNEIGALIGENETQIFEDIKLLYASATDYQCKRKAFADRIAALIKRFPAIPYNRGAKECGMKADTWRRKAMKLVDAKRIDPEYIARKTTQLSESADLVDKTSKKVSRHIMEKVEDMLTQMTTTDGDLNPDDLIGTDEVMRRLWITTVHSVLSGKLKPKNFGETKSLLSMMMQYMQAEDDRKRRAEERDPFRPYMDIALDTIYSWIDEAIVVLGYMRKFKAPDIARIKLIRSQLADVGVAVHHEGGENHGDNLSDM